MTHSNKYIPALNGLRGLAVLWVFFAHLSNQGLMNYGWLDFSRTGRVGVYLFFILSAFLLDRQIIKSFFSNEKLSDFWKNYVLRRFLRIYPMFLLSLLSYWLLTNNGIKTPIWTIKSIFGHLLLVRFEGIFWSIPVEVFYYAVSPFLLSFSYRSWSLSITRTILFLAFVGVLFSMISYGLNLNIHSPILYAPLFLSGGIIALLVEKKKQINHKLVNGLSLASILIIILLIPAIFQSAFGLELSIRFKDLVWVYIPLWGIVLLACVFDTLVKRLFSITLLQWVGKVSFSLYLFHMPVIYWVKHMQFSNPLFIILLLSGLVSVISYYIFEKPLARIYYSKGIIIRKK